MNHLTLSARGIAFMAALAVISLLSLVSYPRGVSAGTGIGVEPTFPPSVDIGATGVAVSVSLTNISTGDEAADTLTLTSIKLNTSCGDFDCTTFDGDVFALSASGTGAAGTGCAGATFTISAPDGSGFHTFTSGVPITLAAPNPTDSDVCQIDFTVDVLSAPGNDASAAAGLQTVQRAEADGVASNQNPGLGVGTDITTVQQPDEQGSPTPSPTALAESATPSPAGLPQTGGSPNGWSGSYAWLIVLAAIGFIAAAAGFGVTSLREQRDD